MGKVQLRAYPKTQILAGATLQRRDEGDKKRMKAMNLAIGN
jgi:hypothetical protein